MLCKNHKFIIVNEEEVCQICGMVKENQDEQELAKLYVDNEEFMELNYYGNIDPITEKLAMSNILYPNNSSKQKRLAKIHQRMSYREKDVIIYRTIMLIKEKFNIPYFILLDAWDKYIKYLKEHNKKVDRIKLCKFIIQEIKERLNPDEERMQDIIYNLQVNMHIKRDLNKV
ncbi:MAG: hypothetical protein KatS3mg003_1049 [Candidatus Nitrosocaldaceae archaeon]|nr:MAG: hypothetical protein KatS3mg003_1049 [Candidatus Nitrosocaldaceae archaeon]